MSLHLFLYIAAAIAFFIAALPVPSRFNLVALGLFFAALTHIV